MASTVERTADGIVYKSATFMDVPNLDILTLLFESKYCDAPEDRVLHADAEDPSNHVSKRTLRQLTKKLAHLLRHCYGIGAQGPSTDVVLVISTGDFMLPLLFYGIIAAEGIYSATSPASTVNELAGQLHQTPAKLILCKSSVRKVALAAAARVGLPLSRVLTFRGAKGDLQLWEAGSGATVPLPDQGLTWRRITYPEELLHSVVCLLSSSGTTGLPKAMKLSHRNMVASSVLVLEPVKAFNAANQPPDFRYVSVAHLPVAHIAGVQGYLVNGTYVGGTTYWMDKFDFVKLCEHSRTHKATTMFTVPPVYLLIAKSDGLVTDHFDTLTDAVSGAAPMREKLQVEAGMKLGRGRVRLRQTWGLSETTGSITVVPLDAPDPVPGTVGGLLANCCARVVDEKGDDVEPGREGEILVKGPIVVQGYWKNAEADADAFEDGWFHTGDIGLFRLGFFYIVDRKKELIKYKGTQVAPAELEAVLISHPDIADAAVIGVEADGTELPRAYVVAESKQTSATEIELFVAERVAPWKRLRGGVLFMHAIPKSPSGKILRKELRELASRDKIPAKL